MIHRVSNTNQLVMRKQKASNKRTARRQRGNIDEATTTFTPPSLSTSSSPENSSVLSPLPPNHKFSRNDVIVMTLQPQGNGDFLGTTSLPTNKDAVSVEARVLNVGPTYIDVAIPSGKFLNAFGPASNNRGEEGKGDLGMRVRVDRFFSDVPFKRMVAALGQLTSLPEQKQKGEDASNPKYDTRVGGFQMDNLLKEVILSTMTYEHMSEDDIPYIGDLPKKLAKPPLPTSTKLANQVMSYIEGNPNNLFPRYNEPQLTAIRSALTRRLTLIQGPPGTNYVCLFFALSCTSLVLTYSNLNHRHRQDHNSRIYRVWFCSSMP